MAKPNYAYEKRQKELAKKQKKQEKLEQRKASHEHAGRPESDESLENAAENTALAQLDAAS
jgi:hypothetical protein